MTEITVKTQDELDKALTDKVERITIDSPAGVWLHIGKDGQAYGSSCVVAYGSSRVVAHGSSSVEAYGSSRVEARGSSRVVARGSSSVVAYGSSCVVAYDSSRVEARGSSSVEAYGSSRVKARGSSSVEAYGSSRVKAGKFVAVHLWSSRVTLTGGVVIDLTKLDLDDLTDFTAYHGLKTTDTGHLIVYKAVNANLTSGWGTTYPIGETVTAPDWKATPACGAGLHFSPSPAAAKAYAHGATRFLECHIDPAETVALGDKVKTRSCVVVREVDIHGDPIGGAS